MKMIDTYINSLCKELDVKIKIKHLLLRDTYWMIIAAKLASLIYLNQKVINHPIEMKKVVPFCKSLVEEMIGRKLVGEVYPDEEYYSSLEASGDKGDDIYSILLGIKVNSGYTGDVTVLVDRILEFIRDTLGWNNK